MLDCALGLVFDEGRRAVLLVKRKDVSVWVLPGGGIEPGETSESAVVREVEEETGLKVIPLRCRAILTPKNKLTRQTFLYECSPIGGVLSINEEASDVSFFSLNSLPKQFFTLHRLWLEEVLASPELTIKRPIKEVTIFTCVSYILRNPLAAMRFFWTKFTS